ncbi:hypothetical protein CAPTEDRAFT_187205 [Capitella teleta]|uniref:Leucine-rich repeat-containing protein 20 n=1 Tax=Capitella teleta TaxID=283909 RepID=R7VG09_CAPTE|nr:hypothetical protein CAPTEDRAFT_187205 [Capitella teleta]|eukprot:ELU15221.1 hypothetical protein CAPTEDRAFT_187205 [Capitella teleta]
MAKQAALVALRCTEISEKGHLNLSDCDLTKVPDGIFMLTRSSVVTSVDFERNKLRRLSPEVANKYPQLTELNLCQNFLQDLPLNLDSLSELRVLDLSWNSLHFIPAVVFRIPKLERLILKQNQITRIPMKELREMKSLRSIDIENNPLTEETFTELQGLAADKIVTVHL